MWPRCIKYLLSGRSMMRPIIHFLNVSSLYEVFIEWMEYDPTFHTFLNLTSLYKVFIEWMEYDDTFHTFSHCDLTDRNIYWGNGVRWHLSHLFSLWPDWLKYLLPVHSLNTSYSEVTVSRGMKDVIKLHPLHKYFMQWGHKQRCERCHCTPSTQ
jgi:hypothetical protein